MKNVCFLLVCFLALCFNASYGQRQELITLDASGLTFDTFVKKIEEQTEYRFFYKPTWTDSLSIDFNTTNKTIEEVLTQLFAPLELYFFIDKNKGVFITYRRKIFNELPVDYFQEVVSTDREANAFHYAEYENKEERSKAVEEKLYYVGIKTNDLQGNATLAGIVKEAASGEPIVGAAVYLENTTTGVATDPLGYYSLTLPKGRHRLAIKSIGMKGTYRNVMLYANGKFDIELEEEITSLKEVLVESERGARVASIQMGAERLDIKTMKQMPLMLGETDIMKVMLTLPGVQTVGEGSTGINVRGGATNQNLILFNDAVVYNPSHLFGFFSTFNPDVLKSAELYKSGIDAAYGSRISSVLDVRSREGNLKKFSVSGGISPITGRVSVEGPIVKEKTSFVLGVRSTYSDWLLSKLSATTLKNSAASFYDITAMVNHKMNDNNNLYLSVYKSQDRFRFNRDTLYDYSDGNASLKWQHIFNNKLYGVLTGTFSRYAYTMQGSRDPLESFKMNFWIRQAGAKVDVSYIPNPKHTFNAGLHVTRYDLMPGNMQPLGAFSVVTPDRLQFEQGIESAVYVSDQFEINPALTLYLGTRYSTFHYIGERQVYQYAEGLPLDESSIVDTVTYASGRSIASHGGFEPRISARYMLSKNSSIKVSYNRMRQYIQMLSNTTAITPTDVWKLSDQHIKPQIGDQVSLGFYSNLRHNTIELSLEGYYKSVPQTIDYKDGAKLLMNHHLETDVAEAVGEAYGIEFLVKRAYGKLNGWISYTYSRSFIKINNKFPEEEVNEGDYYPSNFDKPHAVNVISNYRISKRFNFSLNVVYSTGRPITLPIAVYSINGTFRPFYSERNQYRIPDYFRTDFSVNLEGSHKVDKPAHSSWTFSIYNLTGRKNAYSVFFVTEGKSIKGYKLSIFGQPIPTITYNFKF